MTKNTCEFCGVEFLSVRSCKFCSRKCRTAGRFKDEAARAGYNAQQRERMRQKYPQEGILEREKRKQYTREYMKKFRAGMKRRGSGEHMRHSAIVSRLVDKQNQTARQRGIDNVEYRASLVARLIKQEAAKILAAFRGGHNGEIE